MARNGYEPRATVSTLNAQQYVLPWQQPVPASMPPASARDNGGEDVADPISSPDAPPKLPAKPVKLRLRDRVERLLRAHNIPYVNVDEAKRALFASAKLRSFHFVAYMQTGTNWLIFAAAINRQAREDMAEWERVFGEGFIAVLASPSTGHDTQVRFRTLDRGPLTLAAPTAPHTEIVRMQGGGAPPPA